MLAGQTRKTVTDIAAFASEIDRLPIDRESVAQHQLDIGNRSRTSLFPWRGQFSPQLIEVLLEEYAPSGSVIADPFVGSGTTLFEAARKSLTCFGAEINPAAVEMASTVHFVNIQMPQRRAYIAEAQAILQKHAPPPLQPSLFESQQAKPDKRPSSLAESFQLMLGEASGAPFVRNIIANAIIQYIGLRGKKGSRQLHDAFNRHTTIVERLPYSQNHCRVFHRDARSLPLQDQSVDFIVTSPPYINVFNYHQHYRRAMELMGWDLLKVAKSEFGSNRKNRGNRFLTVIQYAIDMLQALHEMRRVIHSTGKVVIVIGRESKVRGISFENGRILTALAVGGAGLSLTLRQERKFLNRFGETIYEDVLHFVPVKKWVQDPDDFARSVAQLFLQEAANYVLDDTREDIRIAIERAPVIEASPRYAPPSHSTIYL